MINHHGHCTAHANKIVVWCQDNRCKRFLQFLVFGHCLRDDGRVRRDKAFHRFIAASSSSCSLPLLHPAQSKSPKVPLLFGYKLGKVSRHPVCGDPFASVCVLPPKTFVKRRRFLFSSADGINVSTDVSHITNSRRKGKLSVLAELDIQVRKRTSSETMAEIEEMDVQEVVESTEELTTQEALKQVLRRALAHNGLRRGLHE